MNRADQLIDRAADRLRNIADRAAAEGGITSKLAEPLAEDAAFLRKLKPSLIVARAKGELPTDLPAGSGAPAAPSRPQLGSRPKRRSTGPSPFLVIGAAFVTGIVLAKLIDWRGHAHPRD
ncbi:MAG TPA: hypothetical protein VGU26_05550 [Gaiellaceae bacterium]|jgi:hypothetical protein|nr:hypothetical protein [Gaiellaceae bacterium]